MRTRLAIFLCVVPFLANVAQADPIRYDEAVNGDLPDNFFTAVPFALDIGTNTFRGRLFAFPLTQGVDTDSIRFTVPSRAELTHVSYTFAATRNPDVPSVGLSFNLVEGNNPSIPGFGSLDISFAPPLLPDVAMGSAFQAALPLGPGIYGVFQEGLRFTGPADTGFSQTISGR